MAIDKFACLRGTISKATTIYIQVGLIGGEICFLPRYWITPAQPQNNSIAASQICRQKLLASQAR
ncbi:hypothetical protein [Aliterella atlantica]|uniref:hypothetical protein n=1 Tax=Aliterella atlantica TaxID=1827278 RepID=UPI0011852079|nr:hypothetical protein [Aliterella atlantica]